MKLNNKKLRLKALLSWPQFFLDKPKFITLTNQGSRICFQQTFENGLAISDATFVYIDKQTDTVSVFLKKSYY